MRGLNFILLAFSGYLFPHIESSPWILFISSETAWASGATIVESFHRSPELCDFTACVRDVRRSQAADLLFGRTAATTLGSADDIFRELSVRKESPTVGSPIVRMTLTAAGDGAEPSSPETIKPKSGEMPEPHWSHLPIWGEKAAARGYRSPLPFGIGATFYDARQPVNVRDLKLGAGGTPESTPFAKVNHPIVSWQQNASTRFDVWLFPFFNVYGVVGYTRGNTRGLVTVTGPVLGLLNQDIRLLAEFHGPTVGGGITLGFGHKLTEWRDLTVFIVGDVNHTVTFLTFKNESLIAETKPQATVAAPRLGLRANVTETINASIWVGGMYQLIQEEIAGSVAGRQLEFIINQRAASPWNALIGGQIEFGKHFNVIVEGGMGDRSSILTGVTFRF